jgi:hypothetical protein
MSSYVQGQANAAAPAPAAPMTESKLKEFQAYTLAFEACLLESDSPGHCGHFHPISLCTGPLLGELEANQWDTF